jgi:hypothetical protein
MLFSLLRDTLKDVVFSYAHYLLSHNGIFSWLGTDSGIITFA